MRKSNGQSPSGPGRARTGDLRFRNWSSPRNGDARSLSESTETTRGAPRRRHDGYRPSLPVGAAARARLIALLDLCSVPEPNTGCWLWLGTINHEGYGKVHSTERGTRVFAHRASYEREFGPIPPGLQIDHRCRTRSCINPRHLEAVTPRTNCLRSTSRSAANAQKIACDRGHRLEGENLRIGADGHRHCIACHKLKSREHYERNREAIIAKSAARRRAAAGRALILSLLTGIHGGPRGVNQGRDRNPLPRTKGAAAPACESTKPGVSVARPGSGPGRAVGLLLSLLVGVVGCAKPGDQLPASGGVRRYHDVAAGVTCWILAEGTCVSEAACARALSCLPDSMVRTSADAGGGGR